MRPQICQASKLLPVQPRFTLGSNGHCPSASRIPGQRHLDILDQSWPLRLPQVTSGEDALSRWVEKKNAKLTHFTTPGAPQCEEGVISDFSVPNDGAYSWTSSLLMVWFECSGFSSTCLLHNKFTQVQKKDKAQIQDKGDMTSMKMTGDFSQSGSRMSQQGDVDDRRHEL